MSTESYIPTEIDPSSSILESIETQKKTETVSSAEYSYKFESGPEEQSRGLVMLSEEKRNFSSHSEDISPDLAEKLQRLLRKNEKLRQTADFAQFQRKNVYQRQIAALKRGKCPQSRDLPIDLPASLIEKLKIQQIMHSLRSEIAQIDLELAQPTPQVPATPPSPSLPYESEDLDLEMALMKVLHASNRRYY